MIDSDKALHFLLYIAEQRKGIDKIGLYKTLYFAERHHLAMHGTPMLGDDFIKQPRGPVPALIRAMVKAVQSKPFDAAKLEQSQVSGLKSAFQVENNHFIVPRTKPDMDFFSKRDLDSLAHGFSETEGLDSDALSEKSHDSAWERAILHENLSALAIAKAGGANEHLVAYLTDTLEADRAFA